MAVTRITKIINLTGSVFRLLVRESDGRKDVPAGLTDANIIVPWASTAAQFQQKCIVIEPEFASSPRYFLWQDHTADRDRVRYSTAEEWSSPSVYNELDGYSEVGGEIAIIFSYKGIRGAANWRADWMQHLAPRIGERPVCEIAMPGTHNSATYDIGLTSQPAPGAPSLLTTLKALPNIASDALLAAWSRTQNLDVRAQLEGGVRYFDLRIALRDDGNFYFVHGLWAGRVEPFFDAIAEFVRYRRELVILSFHQFFDMDAAAHDRLCALFDRHLPGLFIHHGSARNQRSSLNSLLNGSQRIIAIYKNPHPVRADLWPESVVHNYWKQEQIHDLDALKAYLERGLNEHEQVQGRLFSVFGGTLSTDEQTIASRVAALQFSGLYDVAFEVNPALAYWIRNPWWSRKLNIVNLDFFQLGGCVDAIIGHNSMV